MVSQTGDFWREWTETDENGHSASARDPQQVLALRGLLSSDLTPAAVAKQYTEYTSTHPSEVSQMWTMLLDAGCQFPPEQHPRLVELLGAIRDLPDVQLQEGDEGTGSIVRDTPGGKSYEQKLWKDLPHLGADINDWESTLWNERINVAGDEANDVKSRLVRGLKWCNWNAFRALLAVKFPERFSGLASLQYIRDALEEAPWTFPPKTPIVTPEELDEADPRSIQAIILECEVPAAAQWFIIAAPLIWSYTRLSEEEQGGKDLYDSDLWKAKGDLMFNVERWDFWKKRFADIQALEITESTKKEAAKSLAAMEEVAA